MLGQQEETNIDNLLIWEQRSVLGKRGNINIIIIKLKPLSTSHTNHILHSKEMEWQSMYNLVILTKRSSEIKMKV